MKTINVINGIFVIIASLTCSGCFGPPDSFFVTLVGKDLPDFIDMTEGQEKAVTLPCGYQVLYSKENYDGSDKSKLILKDIDTQTEEVLLSGHLGYETDHAFFFSEKNAILFTFQNVRSSEKLVYLYTYDLASKKISSKEILLDEATYKNPQYWLGACAYISELYFNHCDARIYFSVSYGKGDNDDRSYDFYVYDVSKQIKEKVDQEKFDELKNSIKSNLISGYSYLRDDEKLELFSIEPYSDYLPANYKPKYNGIYVNNGSQNVRISRINGHEILSAPSPIWIENGTRILCSSYIFDTTGKYKEAKLVEGKILSVRKK
ncbi:MAG: hypothetical protein MUC65_09770 [Pontiellaceae bacterium]|jgi:hypothetical protein|nr:hypothetical protein [Pontiellaceae bacterium]